MKKLPIILLMLMAVMAGCKSKYPQLADGLYADIQTTRGDILVRLTPEQTPVTVANFVSLAEGTNPFVSDPYKDRRYYDGVTFHRVIKDFMIQGGDPTGSGSGNPGYKFADEIVDSLTHHKAGILSMANAGSGTNGSQFFITHKETPFLDGRHTVFGEVVEGMPVVDSIANTETGAGDKPLKPIVMNKVEIIRRGKEAKNFDAVQILTAYFAREKEQAEAMEQMKSDFAAELAAQKDTAQTLPSGLQFINLKEVEGEKPRIGQEVLVHYSGWLPDGTLFDTSDAAVAERFGKLQEISTMHRGQMTPVPMNYSTESRLIAGFREGLLTMDVGDKIRLFIPPHLGYGPQGSGPIPPNSPLVFDLEITAINQ